MTEPVVDLGNGRIRELKGMPLVMGILYDPLLQTGHIMEASGGKQSVVPYYWNPGTLSFEIATTAGASVGTEVKVTNFPSSFPVTGTFWQATQPISGSVSVSNMVAQGLTDTQLRATPVPVSGSLAITNANLDVALSTLLKPADTLAGITTIGSITNSVAVTGTFWPTTQPVSLTTVPSHDVTNAGTFAVQAACTGSVSVSNFTDTGVTDTQLRATPVPVSIGAMALPTNAAQETEGNLAILSALARIDQTEALKSILVELKVISFYLKEGMNLRDTAEDVRTEFFNLQ